MSEKRSVFLIDDHAIVRQGLRRLIDSSTDFVVMGAVARRGIKRLFIGSTAERVLDRLPCDLVIIKPLDFEPPVAVVVSGGNLDPLVLMRIIRHGMAAAGRYLTITVRVPDRPGSLARVLNDVMALDANVLDIEHNRVDPGLAVDEGPPPWPGSGAWCGSIWAAPRSPPPDPAAPFLPVGTRSWAALPPVHSRRSFGSAAGAWPPS